MARSDLLLQLARAGAKSDQPLLRRTLEAIIAEERAKQHHVLAKRLEEVLGNGLREPPQTLRGNGQRTDARTTGLLWEVSPDHRLEDLILPEGVVGACRELVEEHQRRELLRSYGLEPRHRVLLVGPPGNGKTSLAHALAESLIVPLFAVRYEGVIGSYLGETAGRLARLFDHVRTRPCVLFFDEFDTLGKERGDTHETGEIKRVVSSLLLQIDDLPSHVLVVTATNHDELLDRAVWRRFQLRLELPRPGRRMLKRWFERYSERTPAPLGYQPRTLADKLTGLSFAEVEELGLDIYRRWVLGQPDADMKTIVQGRLAQIRQRFEPKNAE
jgi:SpoVK/Ycf46/Vps4 family AAA+-type ATPase